MKKYNLQLGSSIATVLALSLLPVRLSEGQAADPVNLIGSEVVIWLMCLSMWLVTYHIYFRVHLVRWQKAVISLVFCALLSILFYYGSNPFFEDYPIKPIRELPLWVASIRLSLRGLLMGLIMVPVIFLREIERQRQREELQRERDRTANAEQQRQLLEELVIERTAELEHALSVLSASQDELDHQVHLLTRVVASITHDVNAPLRFIIEGAERMGDLIGNNQFKRAAEYNRQLVWGLTNIATFMHNHLAFAKGQIHKGSLHLGNVNLAALVREKTGVFEQILSSRGNTLKLLVDERLAVTSNGHLLGVILHNLVDNATKNTGDGVIEIATAVADGQLHLDIQNTIPAVSSNENADADRPYKPDWDLAQHEQDGQGLGLILVRDISALLNIDFLIGAAAGKVTARITFAEFHVLQDSQVGIANAFHLTKSTAPKVGFIL
ncbi:Signal transduction histidine kinase [Dyadobacter soli]|uniref:histidine kinase n=1 Tax=Dyadobacter soli TaxID=659014 RepID=A0A1G8BUZ5_9BACT|nr:HAMP domain-containing sensor histidine kinase [Dyadobacter soli]SDH36991.1 Signal transduction histidine kinase [Dyadobacter soli]